MDENALLRVEVQVDRATGQVRQFQREAAQAATSAQASLTKTATAAEASADKTGNAMTRSSARARQAGAQFAGTATAISAMSAAAQTAGARGGPIFTLGTSLATMAAAGVGPVALAIAGLTTIAAIMPQVTTEADRMQERILESAKAFDKMSKSVQTLALDLRAIKSGLPATQVGLQEQIALRESQLQSIGGRGPFSIPSLEARARRFQEILAAAPPGRGSMRFATEQAVEEGVFDSTVITSASALNDLIESRRREQREIENELRLLRSELAIRRDITKETTDLATLGGGGSAGRAGSAIAEATAGLLAPMSSADRDALRAGLFQQSIGAFSPMQSDDEIFRRLMGRNTFGLDPMGGMGGIARTAPGFFMGGGAGGGIATQARDLGRSLEDAHYEAMLEAADKAGRERSAFVAIGTTTANSITDALSASVMAGSFDGFLVTLGSRVTQMFVDALLAATIQAPLQNLLGGVTSGIGAAFGFGVVGGGGRTTPSFGVTDPSLTPLIGSGNSGVGLPTPGTSAAELGLARERIPDVVVVYSPREADLVAAQLTKRGKRAIVAGARAGRPLR